MIKDNEMIEIYSEYEHKTYLPTQMVNGTDYVVEGSYAPTFIPWSDIKFVNRISKVFQHGKLRFGADIEETALKELRINMDNFYPKKKIEEMILSPKDEDFRTIIGLKELSIIKDFLSVLVYLENQNEYHISEKFGLYIRARKEELEKGSLTSELTYTPTKQYVPEVIVEEVEEIVEEKPKATTAAKKPGRKPSATAKKK